MDQNYEEQVERESKVWYRIGCFVTIVLAIAFIVFGIVQHELVVGFATAYVAIAFGLQLGHDTVVDDIFFWGWHKSIDMPGVIFSLDVDGILFFLGYKLIIAPIITLLLFLFFGLLGTVVSLVVSIFTFPFKAFSVIRETF